VVIMWSEVGIVLVLFLESGVRLTQGRLVVNIEDLDALAVTTIEREATLVETIFRETECEGVRDKVRVFEYLISENGKEERETAELVSKDVNTSHFEFNSSNETWIKTIISYRPDLNCLDQDDSNLVSRLQSDYLHPPSAEGYNLSMIPSTEPQSYSHSGQDIFLDKFVFKGQVNEGFFIEAGADDFVVGSNTLWFEMKHQWTGVLVEPNPTRFPKGFVANRKAWGAPYCLATQTKPHFSPFQVGVGGLMSGLIPEHDEEERLLGLSYDLQCFPLFSTMLAVGNPTINYLSLDIEGAEFQVLQSLPWDQVDIEVLGIELEQAGKVFPGSWQEVHMFLARKGYEYVGTVEQDDLFVRRDLSQGKYKIDFKAAEEFETYKFYDGDQIDAADQTVGNKDEL